MGKSFITRVYSTSSRGLVILDMSNTLRLMNSSVKGSLCSVVSSPRSAGCQPHFVCRKTEVLYVKPEARTSQLARMQPAGEELSQKTHITQETHRETSQVTRGGHTRTEETRTEETSGQNQINAAGSALSTSCRIHDDTTDERAGGAEVHDGSDPDLKLGFCRVEFKRWRFSSCFFFFSDRSLPLSPSRQNRE